jgi:RNA polymerase sporulation-specific sigma factor
MITAVKTATRNKHTPLNQYLSFSASPAGMDDSDATLEQILPCSNVHDPASRVISNEEIAALINCISTSLSELEASVLKLYLDDYSYEEIAAQLECPTKTVDNALQRVKRKVDRHLESRELVL